MCYLPINKGCSFGLFCLSCWDLPNHGASCCTLGIIGKPLMSRGAPIGFISFQPTVESLLNIEDGEKNCINLIRSLKMVSCWAAVDCSHCSIEFTIVQSFVYVMLKASEAAKTPKLGLIPTHDSPVPSLSKCESGKFIGIWHFQQLHNYEKYDKF